MSKMKELDIQFKEAEEKAKELGWELIKMRPVSNHPDDKHLSYTLIKRKNQYAKNGIDYATHLYNAEFKSFNWGHYDIESYQTAVEDFNERGE